jgi:hypothetical protein
MRGGGATRTRSTKVSESRLLRRVSGVTARIPTWTCALVFYAAFAVLTIGRYAIVHPRTVCACDGGADPAQYMWAMIWWPHAIINGLNPFVSHYLWAPTGVNLAQAAMVPTAAIAMAPLTALFGPIFSYNVLSIASPALAAFTAYLLCRRVVRRELPAVAGGFLFGFSSYELSQLVGHLNLVTIFLIPVMVHITLRRVDRELSRRTFVLGMALLLILQMGLSTELLAESVMLGMAILVCARLLAAQPQRARMTGLIAETVAAGLIAVVVTSPFLYYVFFSGGMAPGSPRFSDVYGLDLTNLIFPTLTTWLGHHDFQSLSSTYEQGDLLEANGYLSIAILIAFATWFFTRGRRSVLGKLLAIAIAVSVVMALGSHLHIAGYQTIMLPFSWLNSEPIFDNIIPSRIVLFASLAISIGVAAWLAQRGGRAIGRWLVVLVGVVMILPNTSASLYGLPPTNPSFFSTNMYRHYLARDETVLVLPFAHNDVSTLWQAETDYYFYMPEGYVSGVIPYPFDIEPNVVELFNNRPPPASWLETFIHAHYVSHVVVDPALAGPWPKLLASMGLRGRRVGGVLLYLVHDGLAVPHA